MMAEWPTFALYWYAPRTAGEIVDPIFGKSLHFYLFTLPAWQLITGWLLTLAVIACGIAVFFHSHHRQHPGVRGPSRQFDPTAMARIFRCVRVLLAGARDARVYQPVRGIVRGAHDLWRVSPTPMRTSR